MSEFYPEALTARSWELYRRIKAWGQRRSDATLIGGWAVFELVTPGEGVRSRDIDVVLQSPDALWDFDAHCKEWNLVWRTRGRRPFKELRFPDDEEIVVDAFTTDAEIGAAKFGMHKVENCKPSATGQAFLPDLRFLLRDKAQAALERGNRADAESKAPKDLLDLFLLVNHNRAGVPPRDLRGFLDPEERQRVAGLIAPSRAIRPDYDVEFRALERWLRQPIPSEFWA